MKWQVRFRQKQPVCCPPSDYWIVRTEVVTADSSEQAAQQVLRAWRYNHTIEIKTVEEINDDQEKGQCSDL